MSEKAENQISRYYKLRKEIDLLCDELGKIHNENLSCKNGCDLCCMAISVFPVEFYAIHKEMGEKLKSLSLPKQKNVEDCQFLKNHSCTIYPYRPIICRTHGLPLIYMNEEGSEWELSHCELNFTNFDVDDFDHENTYPQDTLNSKLFMINRDFVANFKEKEYSETDRIPLLVLLQ